MQRKISVGLLGTVAVHLFFLVLFLAVKLHDVRVDHKDTIEVEIKQEDPKPVEKNDKKVLNEEMADFSKHIMSNAVSNLAADKLEKEISTSSYEQEVKNELGIKDLHPKYEQTEKNNYEEIQPPTTQKTGPKKDPNKGFTRISYLIKPNRNSINIPIPIYRCEGGGTIVIGISIDQVGSVTEASVQSSTTSEECIVELALESARKAVFASDFTAPKKATGIITYVFVPQ